MKSIYASRVFHYQKKYLKSDLIAAVIVTAIAIPESLGFAVIVGLPAETGLYSALLAPIVFAIFATTRRLIIGADSATATMIAAGAVLVAQAGSAQYAGAVALLTLMVAAILFLMAVFRLGFLADFISRPVLIGFLGGVGVQLVVSQLPAMIGLSTSGDIFNRLAQAATHLQDVNGMTLTVSVLVVGLVILFNKSRIPGELLGLILAGLFGVMFQLEKFHVVMVGQLPTGFPSFALPEFTWTGLLLLIPAALAIALVIVAQSSAVIRSISGEHEERINLNKDIRALGIANLVSSLTHGFAVNGSPPRSMAADMSGAKTRLVGVYMSLMIALVLLFGGEVFRYIPQAALASIVFIIGLRLIRFSELEYLWSRHRTEFLVALIALTATAALGVRYGIVIAVVVSLMERLRRQYHPKDEILLRDGVLSAWAKERVDHHHRHEANPNGVLVYSFENSLFFENVHYFRERLTKAVSGAKHPVNYVIVDAGAMESVDYTAIETLKKLIRQFESDDITIAFAHVSPHLFEQFDEYGVLALVGKKHIYSTLNSALTDYSGSKLSTSEMVRRLKAPESEYMVIGGAVLEALNIRETHDVDLVVSDAFYALLKSEKKWQEYTQDNGKNILSHEGYNVMHSWMGMDLERLEKHMQIIDGVRYMGTQDLIKAKRQLARKKDLNDVALLEAYLSR